MQIAAKPAPALSKREEQVYRMLAAGISVTEIGKALFLSVKTISTYRARILDKLKLADNAAVTRHAIQNRVITVDVLPVGKCMAI